MAKQYQIAARIAQRSGGKDLTTIDTAAGFGSALRKLILERKPRKIIETGTYFGLGTTRVIAEAIRDAGLEDAQFVSIEINPKHCLRAQGNIAERRLRVELLNGLSVPRVMLPTLAQIEEHLVKQVMSDGLVVDHEADERSVRYFAETNFPDAPDDLLGRVLRRFNYQPDLLLLDSGGHMGWAEFNYVVNLINGPCVIALDDIRHVKHFRSFEKMSTDPRFSVLSSDTEKFGYCIATFDPSAASPATFVRRAI